MGLTNWAGDEPPQLAKEPATPQLRLDIHAAALRRIAKALESPEVAMPNDAEYLRTLADQLDAF